MTHIIGSNKYKIILHVNLPIFECEVYLSPCASITKYVRARTLEVAIAYLEKRYPESTPVREVDLWW